MTLRARAPYVAAAVIAAGPLAAIAGVGRSEADHRTPSARLTGATLPAERVAGQAAVRTTAANRRAATRDSARLLMGVVPPPGAVVLSRRSGLGTQRTVPVLTPAFSSALASERWSAPGQPAAVLSYVEAHWCRIVWRCWQDRVPYDPARHRALQQRLTVVMPTTAGPVVDHAATVRMAGGVVAPHSSDSNRVIAAQ